MGNEDTQAPTRAMQVWTMKMLSVSVTGGFFLVLLALMFIEMPTASHDAMLMLLGALVAALGSVIQYFFGSSAGSANKDNNKPKETVS